MQHRHQILNIRPFVLDSNRAQYGKTYMYTSPNKQHHLSAQNTGFQKTTVFVKGVIIISLFFPLQAPQCFSQLEAVGLSLRVGRTWENKAAFLSLLNCVKQLGFDVAGS